jgi:excisionase family DNA binding protein
MENYRDLDEIVATLRISKTTAYRWAKSGKIPAAKIGRKWLIDAGALKALFDEKRRANET